MTVTRRVSRERRTKETDIAVTLDLDGSGESDVKTGVGFFDHMLDAFAKHGRLDLTVRAEGDLHIDAHHTVEDVGIVIGQAIADALDDQKGVRRFGHAYCPMDEALTRAAIDLSGRAYLVWRVALPQPKLGDVDTEVFREWFQALASNARLCLHVENFYGENTHHIVESAFKATGLALRDAVAFDERLKGAPASTKGSLGG